MSPYQHGEVSSPMTAAETDLDSVTTSVSPTVALSKASNVTTGKIYGVGDCQGTPRRLSRRHRAGDPAITNEIKASHPARGRK